MTARRTLASLSVTFLGGLLGGAGCGREERRFSEDGTLVQLARSDTPRLGSGDPARFTGNAWSVSEGHRLYEWFNCATCHGTAGGGAQGPPLADEPWIYGGAPGDVFRSIVSGRPNGMPSYSGKIPEYQVWQLTAYVLSLGGHIRKDVSPSRSESIGVGPPPSMQPERPVESQRAEDFF